MQATNLEIMIIVYNTLLPFLLVDCLKRALTNVKDVNKWIQGLGWIYLLIFVVITIGKVWELTQFIKSRLKQNSGN
jgi:hypothetical protein